MIVSFRTLPGFGSDKNLIPDNSVQIISFRYRKPAKPFHGGYKERHF